MPRPAQAIVFDFNGTLSDDEEILARIYAQLMAREGRPLTPTDYARTLAGHTDQAIFARWLGLDEASEQVAGLTRERIAAYRALVADGATVTQPARQAVRLAAARVPVAVASGAARDEIEPVIEAAGLGDVLRTIVAAGDVLRGKPDPETYVRALAALAAAAERPFDALDVVAFEDTEAGIRAAKGAGLRCIAVEGTQPRQRLLEADEIVPALAPDTVARVLAG